MMAWYVFAFVDAVPSRRAGKGLSGPLSIREMAGAFVVVERRADVPPVEFGSLKKHQEVIVQLAKHVPAILPVRFGTLLEPEHLKEMIEERDDDIAEAFELVRGRVQFTWRIKRGSAVGNRGSGVGRRASDVGLPASDVGAKVERQPPRTGAEYLRRVAKAANPAPPAAFRALRPTLTRMSVRQRYQPASNGIPEAVYHLVENARVDRYTAAADALRTKTPRLSVGGPYPAFAFAPEIL